MHGMNGHAPASRHPKRPFRTYKDSGWNGFADWLGKNKRSAFLPYEEAKKVVNALGLKSHDIGRDGRAHDLEHPRQSFESL